MTTARSTHPHVLELEVVVASVVVVVLVGCDVVVVGRARVVVVAGRVVVVGAVVGGTVVVVVGAAVVVVTTAVVVVVGCAAAFPDPTPSVIGAAESARTNAAERREIFGCMRAAYGQRLPAVRDRRCPCCHSPVERHVAQRDLDSWRSGLSLRPGRT
jgi:hypothetical protein